jgi:proton glutamate symport protein
VKQGLWVLAALAGGVLAGAAIRAGAPDGSLADVARAVTVAGDLWLDALRMTLLPLVVSLLIAAIAGAADVGAGAGRLARRAWALFAALIVAAGVYAFAATGALLSLVPVDPEGARALVTSAGAPESAPVPLEFGAWLRGLIPTNVVAAAAENAILPLVVFACVFGFAAASLPGERRQPIVAFFQGVGDAMIVVVNWVLAFAPVGVFALSLALGLDTGLSTVGVIAHYVALVCGVTIGLIVLAALGGWLVSGMAPHAYLRALAPVQVIAASTQSSLASLPAMLQAALGPLTVRPATAEFVLPQAVAMFRLTSPVANLAVALFVAHITGVSPGLAQMGAGLAVAFAVSVSSVGLPGQSSFFASVAPICLAMGVPVEVLPLLLAVEVIPDIFRTIGNVTADLAVTVGLDRSEG